MSDDTTITVRVQNIEMFVEGDLPQDLRDEIRQKMSYVVPGHQFMPGFQKSQLMARFSKKEPWDGTKTVALWQPRGLRAPTGLYSYLKEIMVERGLPYTIVDERLPCVTTEGYATPTLKLYDYQENQVVLPGLERQRGVMKVATGGGKTQCSIAMIVRAAAFPAVFYVTSCDLLRQAHERFSELVTYNGVPAKIGMIGDGKCDIQPITIATVQSCQRALDGAYTKYSFDDASADDKTEFSDSQKGQIKDLVSEAQFVYVDEAQHVSSETIQAILNKSHKARFRIGGSASPWRDDGLDMLIEACFGRRFCDISASFLIEHPDKFLVRPHITFNHFSNKLGSTGNFQTHYTKYVVENDARNRFIAERAIYHMDKARPTIILIKHVPHAERLAALIPGSEILSSSGAAKKTPKNRERYLNQMRDRKLMCIIATSLLDEGVDVPAASVGIFAGGGKSSTRELQRVGRVIRRDPNDPNKDCAWIEEFYDHSRWLNNHAKERRRILETERSFEIYDNRNTMIL